jgi:hypothetical protein
LDLVGQVHTSSAGLSLTELFSGNFRYKTSSKVKDHVDSLKYLAETAKESGAIFINSHSGCDSWNNDQAREFLRQATEIEK